MSNEDQKSQYRWDPLLGEWVIYAPARNKRPFQGKKFEEEKKKEKKEKTWTCPFCPDAPEGAGEWTVKLLPNRFAALRESEFPFEPKPTTSYSKSASNAGRCNVVLYSQDHNASFGTLDHDNIVKLVELWGDTYDEIAENKEIKYIFMMENRGAEIGCSMSHPHGQIYSFPILPTKISRKFDSFLASEEKAEDCIMCKIVKEEIEDKSRIVEKNDHFIAEIPYYAHWPFEVHIMAREHICSVSDLNQGQKESLANIMKKVVQHYDALWAETGGVDMGNNHPSPFFPYVMAMFNAPVNTEDRNKWHFHIEYYSPFRGKEKWKYLAGVELGTNTFLSDNLPRVNAQILREQNI